MSKGSRRRPENAKKINDNWDKIFNVSNRRHEGSRRQHIPKVVYDSLEDSNVLGDPLAGNIPRPE